MATLAENFLDDLNELSDDEEQLEPELDTLQPEVTTPSFAHPSSPPRLLRHRRGSRVPAAILPLAANPAFVQNPLAAAGVRLRYDRLEDVAALSRSERYLSTMTRVREELAPSASASDPSATVGVSPSSYQLLVDCNSLSVELEQEIGNVHAFLKDKYRPKFPELESLISSPVEYARAVRAIGNEEDLMGLNLEEVLSHWMVMVVTTTATTTAGKPLAPAALEVVLQSADHILQLERDKEDVLRLVESRMNSLSPNLSALVGSNIAAKLMGVRAPPSTFPSPSPPLTASHRLTRSPRSCRLRADWSLCRRFLRAICRSSVRSARRILVSRPRARTRTRGSSTFATSSRAPHRRSA